MTGSWAGCMQLLRGESLALIWIQANHNSLFIVGRNKSNPAIRKTIFFSKQPVNVRMQSRYRVRAISAYLMAPFEFNDRIAIESSLPGRTSAMQPR